MAGVRGWGTRRKNAVAQLQAELAKRKDELKLLKLPPMPGQTREETMANRVDRFRVTVCGGRNERVAPLLTAMAMHHPDVHQASVPPPTLSSEQGCAAPPPTVASNFLFRT